MIKPGKAYIIKRKEIQKLKKFSKPKISYKWLSIGRIVPKTKENSFIISKNTILEPENNENNENNEVTNLSQQTIEKFSKEIRIFQTPNMLLSQVNTKLTTNH